MIENVGTETQWRRLKLVQDLGSERAAAKAEGVSRNAINQSVKALKRELQMRGYSPEHDLTHLLAETQMLKGTSTLYDGEGKIKMQWVKAADNKERRLELLAEAIRDATLSHKPFKPIKAPKASESLLLAQLTVTDYHLGAYCWGEETGDDWDISIAREVWGNAIGQMIAAAPNAGVGVLNQLGDFLHFDSLEAVTPMHRHQLDADSRYALLVRTAMQVMNDAIRMMLKKFNRVIVVSAEGNHDLSGSVWLREHLVQMWSENDRVEVLDSPAPYYAIQHGRVMLGYHHGHLRRKAELVKVFAADPRFRKMWGDSDYTYIHTGHLHHEQKLEDGGAIVEQHPTLAGRDAYAARGGWVSSRGAKVHVYHATLGEVAQYTVRPVHSDS